MSSRLSFSKAWNVPPCVRPRLGRGPRGQWVHPRASGTTPKDVRRSWGYLRVQKLWAQAARVWMVVEELGARYWAERRKTTRATNGSRPGFAPRICCLLSPDPFRTSRPRARHFVPRCRAPRSRNNPAGINLHKPGSAQSKRRKPSDLGREELLCSPCHKGGTITGQPCEVRSRFRHHVG